MTALEIRELRREKTDAGYRRVYAHFDGEIECPFDIGHRCFLDASRRIEDGFEGKTAPYQAEDIDTAICFNRDLHGGRGGWENIPARVEP